MSNSKSKKKYLSVGEVAEILGVSSKTLRRWDESGYLQAIRVGQRKGVGDRRYRVKDVEEISSELHKPSQESPDKNLEWLDEKQKRIWKYLSETNNKAANTYSGGVKTLRDKNHPDRYAQSAHSIRELILLLVPRTEEVKPGKKDTHRKRIMRYMEDADLLGGLPNDVSYRIAGQWVKIHKWFTAISHHEKVPKNDDEFISKLQAIEDIVISQIGPFYETLNKLEDLISLKNPSIQDADRLETLLKKRAHFDYFFNNLSSPAWLSLLIEKEFFKAPFDKEKVEGGYRFPWPQGQYLVRVAGQKPNEVLKIIKDTSKVENPFVHEDFLDALLKMPVEIAVSSVDKITKEKWFKSAYISGVSEKGGDLAIKLIKNDKLKDEALRLASSLLDVTGKTTHGPSLSKTKKPTLKKEAAPMINNDWDYKQLLQEKLPLMLKHEPISLVKLLRDKLRKAIKIETGKKQDYSDDGYLYIRRPYVDAEGINEYKIQDMIISAIKDSLDQIAGEDTEILQKAVLSLTEGGETYPIFIRLQMYAFKRYPTLFENEIRSALTNEDFFDNSNLGRDYELLLEEQFNILNEKEKSTIFDWIEKGPGGNTDSRFKEYWQRQKLAPISSYLSKEWDSYYKKLKKKYKKKKEISRSVTWIGPKSPKSTEELENMNTSEVLNFLSNWSPNTEKMFGDSPEGLGRNLASVVERHPQKYTKYAEKFFNKNLRPVYIYHLIQGASKAISQNKKINWSEIILLLEKVSENNLYEYPKDQGYFHNTGWTGVKKASSDFMEQALKKGGEQLPFSYRKKAWKILKKLAEDPDPTLKDEQRYLKDNMDASTLSINTVRGQALHAVVKYALWTSRNLSIPKKEKPTLVPEVKKLLGKHLDPRHDSTLTSRSVFGTNYPQLFYLDRKWTRKNINKIFPLPFNSKLTQSAWQSYITLATFWLPAVKSLRVQYQRAVKHLPKSEEKVDSRLAEHLMLLYWHGEFDLNDKLIRNFYSNANESTKAHAAWYIWKAIKEVSPKKNSPKWLRAKKLWEKRLSQTSELDGQSDEFSTFLEWLSSSPEELNELYPLIIKTIPRMSRRTHARILIEYLAQNSKKFPNLSLKILDKLTFVELEFGSHQLVSPETKEILLAGFKSKKDENKKMAERIINTLGERGIHDYKELLINKK